MNISLYLLDITGKLLENLVFICCDLDNYSLVCPFVNSTFYGYL